MGREKKCQQSNQGRKHMQIHVRGGMVNLSLNATILLPSILVGHGRKHMCLLIFHLPLLSNQTRIKSVFS